MTAVYVLLAFLVGIIVTLSLAGRRTSPPAVRVGDRLRLFGAVFVVVQVDDDAMGLDAAKCLDVRRLHGPPVFGEPLGALVPLANPLWLPLPPRPETAVQTHGQAIPAWPPADWGVTR